MPEKKSKTRQALKTAQNIAASIRNKRKVGLPPGSIMYTGENADAPISMQLFAYDEDGLKESFPESPQKAIDAVSKNGTTWINVDGVHDVVLVEQICKHFNIHPLTIEDIVSTRQRPKVESMEGYLYVVLKVLEYDEEKASVGLEQISLVLGPDFVLSFQERPGDTFEPVRSRLRAGRGRIRSAGADYLLYALIDTVVDNYFVILDRIDERADQLEEQLLTDASKENFDTVYHLKREMLTIWRSVWPLRDVMYRLERGDFVLIQDQTQIYLRDVSDHMTQIIDIVEVTRDLLKGMADLYHSTVGSRTNEVMRVLTIISTIFIPLTFIVGVYGMNFEVFPELKWRYGYLFVWLVMIGLAIMMLIIFRKKKWL
ncbi:magnesium and cobalt transport protein cora [Flammeovirgaceae bacterium 311]|nr:magnesium and cobalt transport protein cora [Flammeovirgaceae bacterium 311]